MQALLAEIRRHKLFFLLVALAGLLLRLWFVFCLRLVDGDALVYGNIALNWLNHGIFGITHDDGIHPTLIRLPGYPAFLVLIFSIAGQQHYGAALIVQALVDLGTCLFVAALAIELMDERAARPAFFLAALCPFTANYTAAPLTETLAAFTTAAALYFGVRGWKALDARRSAIRSWLACGIWIGASTYLRPDNILPLAVFGVALLLRLSRESRQRKAALVAGLTLACAALLPLVPWTARNWIVFHRFQPLASRYAADPDEFISPGFNRWVRTWSADFATVDEIYWKVPGSTMDIDNLPQRAFDSRRQYDATDELISDYNMDRYVDEDLDARFAALAAERVAHSRFRYYVWLPALRIADMWLRPRIEMLPFDLRWWEYREHRGQTIAALALGALNLFYLVAALIGWRRWPSCCALILVSFVLLRSLILGSLENPEPRYVLECFPVVLALAAGALVRKSGLTRGLEARPEP
jgi:4-amino-4-deoxy-L-arabinose transferase-like glycosyltransferase